MSVAYYVRDTGSPCGVTSLAHPYTTSDSLLSSCEAHEAITTDTDAVDTFEVSLTSSAVSPGNEGIGWIVECIVPAGTVWGAGNVTCELYVSGSATNDIRWYKTEVFVARFCAPYGSALGTNTPAKPTLLGTTGLKSMVVSCSAHSAPLPGDRLLVRYWFTNVAAADRTVELARGTLVVGSCAITAAGFTGPGNKTIAIDGNSYVADRVVMGG